jgi:hypothetical protein
MGRFILIVLAILILAVVGGIAFLMIWDIPAPTGQIERVIPDAKLPK